VWLCCCVCFCPRGPRRTERKRRPARRDFRFSAARKSQKPYRNRRRLFRVVVINRMSSDTTPQCVMSRRRSHFREQEQNRKFNTTAFIGSPREKRQYCKKKRKSIYLIRKITHFVQYTCDRPADLALHTTHADLWNALLERKHKSDRHYNFVTLNGSAIRYRMLYTKKKRSNVRLLQ